jgi:hypothetical protein
VAATKRLLIEARRDAVNAACARERAAGLALYATPPFQATIAEFGRDPQRP